MRRIKMWAAVCVGVLAGGAGAGEPYFRTTELGGGGVALETASRVFEDDAGRRVTLVGVTHVGDLAYYRELETLLNEHGLVLYEGVGPVWRDVHPDAGDAVRSRYTRARMRDAAAQLLSDYRHGGRARSREAWLESHTPFRRRLFETALTDAWGRPIDLTIDPDARTFTLVSLGADGEPGGAGADRDLERTARIVLGSEPDPTANAVQARMAEAAGLAFQLDVMDYSSPRWRNADATVAEMWGAEPGSMLGDVDGPADAEGEGGDALFALLSGESGLARAMGSVLKLIGSSARSSFLFRVMLVEMLGSADETMLAAGLGEEMTEMLLHRRNEVVERDLAGALADDPGRSVAVFYGAAHLADLEDRLEARGFAPVETVWHAAVTADPASVGIEPEQARSFRSFVGSMVQMQMAQLRAMRGAPQQEGE